MMGIGGKLLFCQCRLQCDGHWSEDSPLSMQVAM